MLLHDRRFFSATANTAQHTDILAFVRSARSWGSLFVGIECFYVLGIDSDFFFGVSIPVYEPLLGRNEILQRQRFLFVQFLENFLMFPGPPQLIEYFVRVYVFDLLLLEEIAAGDFLTYTFLDLWKVY